MQADFLKYLVLYDQGGVFTDLDAKLIDNPYKWNDKYSLLIPTIILNHVIVCIEDIHSIGPFSMYTIISLIPKQKIFAKILANITNKLLNYTKSKQFNDLEILQIIETLGWSDVVFETMKEKDVNFDRGFVLQNQYTSKTIISITLPSFRNGLSIYIILKVHGKVIIENFVK